LRVDKRYATGGGPSLQGVSDEEKRLHRLIRMGITDGIASDKHWESSTRAMRHTSTVANQLLVIIKEECTKVGWAFLHFGGKF
jgi:hypothetical protein